MIVTCERCEQRYRIRAEKLPPQGGKIRCPTCRHVFVVRPGGETSDWNDGDNLGESIAGVPAVPPPAAKAAPQPAVQSAPAEAMAPPKATPAPAKVETKSATTGDEAETWKLRVAGLTYAFQGLETLQAWLSARDNVQNIKIAKEGDEWHELGDYPEVLTPALLAKFFPLGYVPTSADAEAKAKNEEGSPNDSAERKPTPEPRKSPKANKGKSVARERAVGRRPPPQVKPKIITDRGKNMLIAMGLLLALCAVAHLTGFIDFTVLLPFGKPVKSEIPTLEAISPQQAEIPPPQDPEQPLIPYAVDPLPPEIEIDEAALAAEAEQQIEAEFQEKLQEGQRMVTDKRWPEARAYLEPLLAIRPDNIELHEALLQVYRGLSLKAEIEQTRQRIAAIKKANP